MEYLLFIRGDLKVCVNEFNFGGYVMELGNFVKLTLLDGKLRFLGGVFVWEVLKINLRQFILLTLLEVGWMKLL